MGKEVEGLIKQDEYWKSDRWLSLDDFEGEVWKPVVGHEDSHLVSCYGRVKSLDRVIQGRWGTQLRKGKMIKTKQERTGYLSSAICVFGKINTYKVHRLVGLAFIENPLNKKQIDHIDGKKINNIYSNLRWATSRENNLYKFEKMDTTSKYHGINFDPCAKIWVARITIGGTRRHISRFEDEYEAHLAYQDVLENGVDAILKYRAPRSCKFNFVRLGDAERYQIRKKINGKLKTICTIWSKRESKRICDFLNKEKFDLDSAVDFANLIKLEMK